MVIGKGEYSTAFHAHPATVDHSGVFGVVRVALRAVGLFFLPLSRLPSPDVFSMRNGFEVGGTET
jgi:hypothetical protein